MIKIFEAFAGYGTSTFALKQLNIKHELVGFSEIDKYAIQCFQQNHGGKNFGDITKINWTEVSDFDLLTGGFPCQAFSTAGKQKGEADARGVLGLELTRALIQKQPKYFLFENVKGFMGKKFNETREKFIHSWEDAGYVVYHKVLNTKDFGVPQNRERVWFVGIRHDLFKDYKFPEPFELKLKLKDVLEEKVDEKYFLRKEQVEKLFKKIVVNKNYIQGDVSGKNFKSQQDRVFVGDLMCSLPASRTEDKVKVIDVYNKKIKHDGVCITLSEPHHNNLRVMTTLTQATGNRAGSSKEYIEHVNRVAQTIGQVRRLTPKECFRLQGFLNDEVNLEGLSDTQKYKLAGNGQSVNVVKLLLKELVKNE